jgi:hypothetical protein
MSCQVELKGFQPNANIQKEAEETEIEVETLLDSAPSDAFASLAISRSQDGSFSGHLEVCSEQGAFIGNAWGNSAHQVREELFDQVAEQLDVWRHSRFDMDDGFNGEVAWLGTIHHHNPTGHHHGAA